MQIKKKQLESFLSQVPDFQGKPQWGLEQHMTPPDMATQMIQLISQQENLVGKIVADFGCGTGMLSTGLLCADIQQVIAFELDESAALIAQQTFNELHDGCADIVLTNIKYHKYPPNKIDVVVMNPPFGTKDENIDCVFLQKAFQFCKGNVYSLHKSATRQYLQKFAQERDRTFSVLCEFKFPLPKKFAKYHKKDIAYTEVDFIKFGKEE